MITVTVTETTLIIVSVGDIDEDEWRDTAARHGLHGRMGYLADYRTETGQDGTDLVHYWRFQFTPTDSKAATQ